MRFTVRVDARAGDHFHCTFFANGAKAGRLCLRQAEYQELAHRFEASIDPPDQGELGECERGDVRVVR